MMDFDEALMTLARRVNYQSEDEEREVVAAIDRYLRPDDAVDEEETEADPEAEAEAIEAAGAVAVESMRRALAPELGTAPAPAKAQPAKATKKAAKAKHAKAG